MQVGLLLPSGNSVTFEDGLLLPSGNSVTFDDGLLLLSGNSVTFEGIFSSMHGKVEDLLIIRSFGRLC
jgi:hypothetical protein